MCPGNPCARTREAAIPIALASALLAASAVCGPSAPAQTSLSSQPSDPPLAFDVAAIHENKADNSGRSHIVSSSHDSRFTAINVTLKALIQWAYAMPDMRILGGPAWLNSTRFNIEAKGDSAADDQLSHSADGRAEKQKMLQALLADRFKLAAHQESRKLPVFALVVASKGPRFQPSQVNGTTINAHRGEIDVSGSDNTLTLLADALSRQLGRVVVDETGLKGRYDLTLKFTPDTDAARAGASGATPESAFPSIFTAIQEQLGLKLVSRKGPVPVLVIDGAEMPSEN
jgi:uncharacterized protein (TIGR03435 family)